MLSRKFVLTTIAIAMVLVPLMATRSDAIEEALTVGSKAPALDIEHWISDGNGELKPVTSFESGKVYIVEFWATWCGPCISSMPHLSELQKKYAKDGLQIISISDEEVETVNSFLERSVRGKESMTYGDVTGVYSLTTDPDQSSHADYMLAAGQSGIPSAFIVGKKGDIEWIGHPGEMDKPLDDVINNKWDREAYAKQLAAEQKAMRAIDAGMQEVMAKMQAGETDDALDIVDGLIATHKDTSFAGDLAGVRLELLLETGDKRAAKALTKFAAENNDPEILNQIGWMIVEMKTDGMDLDASVLTAASNIVEQAVAARPNEGAMMDTLAHLYHLNGQLDKAISTQQKALASAGESRADIEPFLQQLLDEKAGK